MMSASLSRHQVAVALPRTGHGMARRHSGVGVLVHWLVICIMAMCCLSSAMGATRQQPDTELEAKVMEISQTLRCLVCQNQSIAESNAPLAADLRDQVREQLRVGRSERQIMDYMVARYGDFVLYRPALKTSTLLLWAGPGILLISGLTLLFTRLRSRSHSSVDPVLSHDDQCVARRMLVADACHRDTSPDEAGDQGACHPHTASDSPSHDMADHKLS